MESEQEQLEIRALLAAQATTFLNAIDEGVECVIIMQARDSDVGITVANVEPGRRQALVDASSNPFTETVGTGDTSLQGMRAIVGKLFGRGRH